VEELAWVTGRFVLPAIDLSCQLPEIEHERIRPPIADIADVARSERRPTTSCCASRTKSAFGIAGSRPGGRRASDASPILKGARGLDGDGADG
jgi:hypothetical protein